MSPITSCLSLILILTLHTSCQQIPKIPVPKPSEQEILNCDVLKPEEAFNGLRIKAFQDFIEQYVQNLKQQPTSPEHTEKLAVLERLRRRITWPLISVKLRNELVTDTLEKEIEVFRQFIRSRPPISASDEKAINELNEKIFLNLENQDQWLCPVKVVVPEVPPPIPTKVEEKDPSGKPQTIIFED